MHGKVFLLHSYGVWYTLIKNDDDIPILLLLNANRKTSAYKNESKKARVVVFMFCLGFLFN